MDAHPRGLVLSLLLSALAFAPSDAGAVSLPDRAALQAFLTTTLSEDFETLADPGFAAAYTLDVSVLDSTTVDPSAGGPGLVLPGITFVGSAALQANGDAYFGLTTRTLLSNGSTLTIDFAVAVLAFGVDLDVFDGYADDALVSVYGPDDSTLLASFTGLALPGPGRVFFGYEDAALIGSVVISATNMPWSPIIDDLEFGFTAAPAPAAAGPLALALAGLAALRRRRRR